VAWSQVKAGDQGPHTSLKEKIDAAGNEFLSLEKYVNLNFSGFHKILKKHDKVGVAARIESAFAKYGKM
jgi:SPX domain protein involved in polyphosphate accumulation